MFAPYVDTGESNTTLTTVAADDGTQFFTLAFVNGAGCQWSLPNQSGWQSQVAALQAEGGDVSISFGGYTVDTDATDLNVAYTSGNEVSYGGNDWTANQWNYDEAPGGAAGAWTSDGPC